MVTLADMLHLAQQVSDELGVKPTVVQTHLSELEVVLCIATFWTGMQGCLMVWWMSFVRIYAEAAPEKKEPPAMYIK